MPLDQANIVPENNLRLPDALSIEYGPAPLLSRFVLAADRLARDRGLWLRVRYDFDELVWLNKRETANGTWYPLPFMFDPKVVELTPDNAYWISGENDVGEIVCAHAAHIYRWPGTSLKEEACALFYGSDEGQPCIVTAPAAELISGIVYHGGAAWVRPDFRGRQLSHILPRVLKAFGSGRWPIEWYFGYVKQILAEKGVAHGYGIKHLSDSGAYPGSPWGDVEFAVAYSSAQEHYADLSELMSAGLSKPRSSSLAPSRVLEHSVTNTSAEGVFHGNSSLS